MSLFLQQNRFGEIKRFITCPLPVDPLQWMGAIRMWVKQLIKNITIIHVAPVHQFLSCEVKSCMFVRNKSIIKMFLTSNCCFCLKCDSYIHIAHLNQERNMHRSSTIYKRKQSKHFLNENVGGFWCERATVDGLFNGGSFIKDYGWFWPEAKLNTQLFASKDINWRTGVVWVACGLLRCFYQLFGLSFWRHPFTAEDPLVSNWCNAKCLALQTHTTAF